MSDGQETSVDSLWRGKIMSVEIRRSFWRVDSVWRAKRGPWKSVEVFGDPENVGESRSH